MNKVCVKAKLSGLLAAVLLLQSVFASERYEWELVSPAGSGCFPPKCIEGQFPTAVMPLVGFEGKLYSIGDKGVWLSANGTNWISKPKTDWGERYGMQFAFFNNKLWMLGGTRRSDPFGADFLSPERTSPSS